jgi:RNA polymerase sigma-70 factor (ECF subfamily)
MRWRSRRRRFVGLAASRPLERRPRVFGRAPPATTRPMNRTTPTPESLHARYAGRIDRQIRRLMGRDNEREDLVHEVLITVFRRVDTLRNPVAMDAWVARVTTNTLKYTLRRRRVRQHVSLEALPETQVVPWQADLEGRDLAGRAARVLDRLPASDRTLLMTYWFTSATADSIADEARCSIITVRRRLSRAQSRFEKLARHDPALARCIEDARTRSRRWRRRVSE